MAGLSGIPSRRGRIVRPLLSVTRREIEAYLQENGIPHVEDSSNSSDAFSRNRLRHQVVPVLRELNPRFAEAVGRTAELLREDEDYLSAQAAAFLADSFDGESVPLEALCALHPAISSRVLRALCPRALEQTHVNAALRFIRGSGLGSLNLPGLRLRREQGRLYLKEPVRESLPDRAIRPEESIDLPEAGLRLSADVVEYHGEIYDLFKTYLFKCENICGTLYCTGRRPGDRLHPQGRNCGKSLHDLFRDAGLTQTQRDRVPVLRDDMGVLAVLGFPADERARPAAGDRVLRIRITEI
jgi:tRNA(Ile)-lysidine synthase